MNSAAEKIETETTVPGFAIQTRKLNLWYGTFQALFDVNLKIKSGMITSLIGPSGCGKSTFLRSVNRINERLGYVRIDGQHRGPGTRTSTTRPCELVQVRKQVGMVFQRPNPLADLDPRQRPVRPPAAHAGQAAARSDKTRSSSRPCARSCSGTR